MKKYKQKIKYDSEGIIQQVQNYTDEYRVIMEYIDNSADSAEDFFDRVTQEYRKQIIIEITKTGGKKSDRKIVIKDNCRGMRVNTNKDYIIFRSSKRNDSRTNGMHGMGMFSGYSICKDISIETKQRTGKIYRYTYSSTLFKRTNKGPPEVDITEEKPLKNDFSSGTKVTLSGFKEGVFEDLDFRTLKKEIEKHFEGILSRKRIKIVLRENDGEEKVCESFKYSDYCDTPFTLTINTLFKTKSKKYKTLVPYDISANPVRIFLILAKNRELKREPFFVIKGRRILDVTNTEQFRSYKKSSLWGRYNLTGYIDVTGVLETTPTRKDFKKTELSKAFFFSLLKYEDEILKYIESQTDTSSSQRFVEIEGKINEILNDYKINDTVGNGDSSYKEYSINGYRIRENKEGGNETTQPAKDKKEPLSPSLPKKRERSNKVTVKFPTQDGNVTGDSSTLQFKIDDTSEPYMGRNDQQLRSIISDNKIVLFKKHEEFQKRFYESAKGYYEFTERIIHYIAVEIMAHLKAIEIRNESDSNEDIYQDFATELYKLEEKMKVLIGSRI
ncbi:MAG: ATP-binding protein [Ignavibacteria bacterium]